RAVSPELALEIRRATTCVIEAVPAARIAATLEIPSLPPPPQGPWHWYENDDKEPSSTHEYPYPHATPHRSTLSMDDQEAVLHRAWKRKNHMPSIWRQLWSTR